MPIRYDPTRKSPYPGQGRYRWPVSLGDVRPPLPPPRYGQPGGGYHPGGPSAPTLPPPAGNFGVEQGDVTLPPRDGQLNGGGIPVMRTPPGTQIGPPGGGMNGGPSFVPGPDGQIPTGSYVPGGGGVVANPMGGRPPIQPGPVWGQGYDPRMQPPPPIVGDIGPKGEYGYPVGKMQPPPTYGQPGGGYHPGGPLGPQAPLPEADLGTKPAQPPVWGRGYDPRMRPQNAMRLGSFQRPKPNPLGDPFGRRF